MCCADCACGAHSDMAAFVSVVVGILFCTTFWDKPKAWALSVIEDRSKRSVDSFRKSIASNPKTASYYDEEAFDALGSYANERAKDVGVAVNGWISRLYIILAVPCGCLGLVELFLSMTDIVGDWNLLLLLPIAAFLILSSLVFVVMQCRIWFQELLHWAHYKVNEKKAEKRIAENKKTVEGMVPEPPSKTEK